jgi:YqaJ-like recombinase protein
VGEPEGEGRESAGDGVSFTVIDAEQRSPTWFAARLGKLTGSRAADMLSTIRTGEAAARRDLRVQLVVERLTGLLQEEPFQNAAMLRGIECEPLAFAAYEALTGAVAVRTGFLAHDTYAAGCSLDGHVGAYTGIVELKAPKSATHLRYLRGGALPSEYLPQVTHNLWVTGAAWCDFLSFDDRFPAQLQTFLVRVEATDLDLAGYEKKALAFLAEVDAEVAATLTLSDFAGTLTQAAIVGA